MRAFRCSTPTPCSTACARRARGRPGRSPTPNPRRSPASRPPARRAARRAVRARQPVQFDAFYSSQLGGILTEPALMVLPFDDHMVHRGHGIFDTAGLVDGRIYDLEAHLHRFLLSADRSKLRLPDSRDDMRDIIVKTAAASGRRDG